MPFERFTPSSRNHSELARRVADREGAAREECRFFWRQWELPCGGARKGGRVSATPAFPRLRARAVPDVSSWGRPSGGRVGDLPNRPSRAPTSMWPQPEERGRKPEGVRMRAGRPLKIRIPDTPDAAPRRS
eukprot:scaffold1990_cov350-Prasinococcus_capsulatus_cf.AAC.6